MFLAVGVRAVNSFRSYAEGRARTDRRRPPVTSGDVNHHVQPGRSSARRDTANNLSAYRLISRGFFGQWCPRGDLDFVPTSLLLDDGDWIGLDARGE